MHYVGTVLGHLSSDKTLKGSRVYILHVDCCEPEHLLEQNSSTLKNDSSLCKAFLLLYKV